MTASPPDTELVAAPPRRRQAFGVDCVYFLMFDGWKNELMSNRWHYAARWARHVPVVLLQPNQVAPRLWNPAEPDPHIPDCEILSLRATGDTSYAADLMIQVGQVHDHMNGRGFERPLLWSYNPLLAGLFAGLPAAGRVYHATENYFHFNGLSDFFYQGLRTSLAISDVVVAVSSGVAASLREEGGRDDAVVITNGCDRAFYRGDSIDDDLAREREQFDRIAVYAGNINSRIDFALIDDVAAAYPSTLLAFFGPVAALEKTDAQAWAAAQRRTNVKHYGPVPSKRLPDLYRTADLGLIPYKPERALVENGFPLKVLEMGATALPVVSTYMRPIVELADAVVVTTSSDAFVRAFGTTDRAHLTTEAMTQLEAVCDANDYDAKFDQVVDLVAHTIAARPLSTAVDVALPQLGTQPWLDACCRYWQLMASADLAHGGSSVLARARRILGRVRRRVTPMLWRALRAVLRPALIAAVRITPAPLRRRLPRFIRRLTRHVVIG